MTGRLAHYCADQSTAHPAHDWTHKYGSEFHCPGQYVDHVGIVDTGTGLIVWHKGQQYALTPVQSTEARAS